MALFEISVPLSVIVLLTPAHQLSHYSSGFHFYFLQQQQRKRRNYSGSVQYSVICSSGDTVNGSFNVQDLKKNLKINSNFYVVALWSSH